MSLGVQEHLLGEGRARRWALLLSLLVVALLGCGESEDVAAPREPFIRFSSPEPGATLSGQAEVRFEMALPAEPDELRFGVDDRPRRPLRAAGNSVVLNTTAFDDGEHTLHVELTDAGGRLWSDELRVQLDNPAQRLLSVTPRQLRYANGDSLVIDLSYSEPGLVVSADLSELDSGFSPGAVRVEEQGGGKYVLSYRLSLANRAADGPHEIDLIARASGSNGPNASVTNRVPIELSNAAELPIVVQGAARSARAEPDFRKGEEGAPSVVAVTGEGRVLSGGSTEIEVSWKDTPERPADKIIVRAPGYSGYYVFPAPEDSDSATLELQLPPVPAAAEPACAGGVCPKALGGGGLAQGLIDLEVAVVDAARDAFDTSGFGLFLILVGTGGVQVSVTWDTPVDLDLSVVDPSGRLLDFEQPRLGSGQLDLDSNALCEISPNFAENIFWNEESHPLGEYAVRVNLFDACGQANVNYRVTIIACGDTLTIPGQLSASQVDMSGAGVEVQRFVVDCRRRVTGKITYRVEPAGEPLGPPLPAVELPVRVVRDGVTTPLAVGTTNSSGEYDIRFDDPALGDYRVEVEASWTDPTTKRQQVKVVPLTGSTPYRISSPPILRADDSMQAVSSPDDADFRLPTRRVDLEVPPAQNSGALNIVDRMRLGFVWVADNVPVRLSFGSVRDRAAAFQPLTVRWANRGTTPENSSYYTHSDRTIHVLDLEAGQNPDETRDQFDDVVLLHEFMHYVLNTASFPSIGALHSKLGTTPAIAVSEGLPTALALDALNTSPPRYQDRWLQQTQTIDIEVERSQDLDTQTPMLTTPGAGVADNIREFVVSAVVWDLLDDAGDDAVPGPRGATFDTVFRHLPAQSAAKLAGRGVAGIDLVDYLDGWRCFAATPLDPAAEFAQDDGIKQVLTAVGGFPYDFPNVPLVCF